MKVKENVVKYLTEKNSTATFQELLQQSSSWANGAPVKERGLKIQLSKLKALGKVFCSSDNWIWSVSEDQVKTTDTSKPEGWNWFKTLSK
jgi:hypothetical protein